MLHNTFEIRFIVSLTIIFTAGLSGKSATAQADPYDLVYDYTDGTLTIVTNTSVTEQTRVDHPRLGSRDVEASGNLINYVLEVENPPGPFIDANFTPQIAFEEVAPGIVIQTGTFTGRDFFLAESNANRVVAGAQTFPLGAVLPTDLTRPEFEGLFDKNPQYVRNLGTGLYEFDLVYVPEPSSLGLLALGGLTLARRRGAN